MRLPKWLRRHRWTWELDLRSPELSSPLGYVEVHVVSDQTFRSEQAATDDMHRMMLAYQTNIVARITRKHYYTENHVVRKVEP